MFCAHVSQNWYAVQLLAGWDLFYRRYDQPIAHSHSLDDCHIDINGNTNWISNRTRYNINKRLHWIDYSIKL